MVSPDGHFTFPVIGVRLCFQSRMQAEARLTLTVLAHDPQNGLAVKLASPLYWIWPRTCTEIPIRECCLFHFRIAKRAFSLRKGFQSYSESIILDIWEIIFEIYPAPYPFADNIRFSVTLGIFN
jgi:hypothetical protein